MKIKLLLLLVFALSSIGFGQTADPRPDGAITGPVNEPFVVPDRPDLRSTIRHNSPNFEAVFLGESDYDFREEGKYQIRVYSSKYKGFEAKVSHYFGFQDESIEFEDFIVYFRGKEVSAKKSTILSEKKIGKGQRDFVLDTSGFRRAVRVLNAGDAAFFVLETRLRDWNRQPKKSQDVFNKETKAFVDSLKFVPFRNEDPVEDTGAWVTKKIKSPQFEVSFPFEPLEEHTTVLEEGTESKLSSYAAGDDRFSYVFASVESGISDGLSTESRDEILSFWESGMLESIAGGKITKKVDVDSKFGTLRRVTVSSPTDTYLGFAFLVPDYIVQVLVSSPKAEEAGLEVAAKKFLDRISYLGKKFENKSVYRNEKYKFEIDLPLGWIDLNKQVVLDHAEKVNESSRKRKKSSKLSNELLIVRRKGVEAETSSFIGVIEFIPVRNVSSRVYSQAAYRNNLRLPQTKAVSRPKLVKINGVSFYMFETIKKFPSGISVNQRLYIKKRSGGFLQFGLNYLNDEDLQTMLKALGSLKWLK